MPKAAAYEGEGYRTATTLVPSAADAKKRGKLYFVGKLNDFLVTSLLTANVEGRTQGAATTAREDRGPYMGGSDSLSILFAQTMVGMLGQCSRSSVYHCDRFLYVLLRPTSNTSRGVR